MHLSSGLSWHSVSWRTNIWTLTFQICFWFKFWPLRGENEGSGYFITDFIKQGGKRKGKAFSFAWLLNSGGMQKLINKPSHALDQKKKSWSNRLKLHTAVFYLMLRGVYNAVIAGERLIQMSKRAPIYETVSDQLFAVNILVTIVFPCQHCNHQIKQQRKQILP